LGLKNYLLYGFLEAFSIELSENHASAIQQCIIGNDYIVVAAHQIQLFVI
jgi:hypothetical protein